MDSSKSVCSRRSTNSRRSTRSNRSTRSARRSRSSRSRSRHPSSKALINGLDELDLRIAALIAEGSAPEKNVDDRSVAGESVYSDNRSDFHDPACLITNMMHINCNRRDTPSKSGHGRTTSSSKSISGKSVKSSLEVREFEIARIILRQAKGCSTMKKNIDNDSQSVVSTFTTGDILGDLTDNEDSTSVRSMRSKSCRRRRSRSNSRHTKKISKVDSISFDSPPERRSISSKINDADSRNEGESERLYNAFMKNLSREERIAHDTKILSCASNVRAEISAANIGKMSKSTVGDWATNLFEERNTFDSSGFYPSTSAPGNVPLTESDASARHLVTKKFIQDIDCNADIEEVPRRLHKSKSNPRKELSQHGDYFGYQMQEKNEVAFESFDESPKAASLRFRFFDTSINEGFKHNQAKQVDVDSPARDAIAVRLKPLPKTSEYSFVPRERVPSKAPRAKKRSTQWNDFSPFDDNAFSRECKSHNHSDTERMNIRHRRNFYNSEEVTGSIECEDPFSIENRDPFLRSSAFPSSDAADFFNFQHPNQCSSADSFCPDPFGSSTLEGRNNINFAGFGRSKEFESIPTGWETEEGSSNMLTNTSTKSALSDDSPTGITDFDSKWLQGGVTKYRQRL